MTAKLLAISDLHVHYEDNRRVVEALRPESDGDWLLIPGDVGEMVSDVEWALKLLSERFATVVWAPGNHELWTHPRDPVRLRGEERYRLLVETCRRYGVVTPEDPYPIWRGDGGPVAIAPLFVLYDYTFRTGHLTKEAALEAAYESGVVCTDEFLLHPDPYPSREAWCRARLKITEARLAELPGDLPIILVNHFPLIREPTEILTYPEFALWCGTDATAAWLRRHRVAATVYGHLHIPRLIVQDGVPHHEVSLGYPKEWQPRPTAPGLTTILPQSATAADTD
ncbi:metallophosphoesterase [Nonomuraea turkmeniaca]|uniref:Metallophosphoesterase n=1 Tax=Nonomuraea turkmeniaca TaxID=103838 RepID=A0A5S4FWR1_9ACTN|nr:metallophosphoesterase [Nonomuraea turkmeniaca]TMR25126.1 metallophosphoesterase [Nonomuraea turkmeniaca]